MNCNRCKTGRVFLDRVFSDNMSLETSCLHCGHREYIQRNSELGKFLAEQERKLSAIQNGMRA